MKFLLLYSRYGFRNPSSHFETNPQTRSFHRRKIKYETRCRSSLAVKEESQPCLGKKKLSLKINLKTFQRAEPLKSEKLVARLLSPPEGADGELLAAHSIQRGFA